MQIVLRPRVLIIIEAEWVINKGCYFLTLQQAVEWD